MDDHRFPELRCELELRREDAALVAARRVVAEEVQSDLSDRDNVRLDQTPRILTVGCLMRMHACCDVDAGCARRDLARRAGRGETRADRDHP